MRHILQLLADSPIQGPVTVSMDICPDGRVAIKVASAETVLQPCPMPRNQHQRLVVGRNPVAHLRERMPDMRFVELNEGFSGVIHGEEMRRSSVQELQELQEFRSQNSTDGNK